MVSMMFESLVDKNFSIYMMGDLESEVKDASIKDMVQNFLSMPIKFATIDLGYMTLREFDKTDLSRILKEHEIPYFTTELPYYVKGHFAKEIDKIRNKLDELLGTYDTLSNKNTCSAQELKILIERYSKDLRELDRYINLKVRSEAIVEKMLRLIEDRDDPELSFVHIGEENTFLEIMRLLKDENVKSNVVFVELSKIL